MPMLSNGAEDIAAVSAMPCAGYRSHTLHIHIKKNIERKSEYLPFFLLIEDISHRFDFQ
jgi:hypothetical protein